MFCYIFGCIVVHNFPSKKCGPSLNFPFLRAWCFRPSLLPPVPSRHGIELGHLLLLLLLQPGEAKAKPSFGSGRGSFPLFSSFTPGFRFWRFLFTPLHLRSIRTHTPPPPLLLFVSTYTHENMRHSLSLFPFFQTCAVSDLFSSFEDWSYPIRSDWTNKICLPKAVLDDHWTGFRMEQNSDAPKKHLVVPCTQNR